jgi:general nucleoside transport system ATP-binding protein
VCSVPPQLSDETHGELFMNVELHDIRKSFGSLRANDGISLTFGSGRIYGLLGENGAGKTTLMKMLSGFLSADSGQILLDGRPVRAATPAQAIRFGVGMLHQDPLDFLPLKVIDNFLMGRGHGLMHAQGVARCELGDLASRFGFTFDPDALVSRLTVGERQQLEILRLLASGVQVLILDEPTTGISAPQKVRLFAALRLLAEQGKTIIFVSHKLEDVQELCAHVAILRKGKVVGEADAPFSTDWLVQSMFGQVLTSGGRQPVQTGASLLDLDRLCVADYRLKLAPVSLTVQAGEVIGLAGIEGSGQRLLLQGCAGLLRPLSGAVRIDGVDMTAHPYRQFPTAGVGYVPAGRLEEGLVAGLSVSEHVLLTQDRSSFFIDWDGARKLADARIKAFSVVGKPETAVDALSGGNQQRALLALLPPNLRLLLLEHPTRGLDIESTRWMWNLLLQRRQAGTAIMFTSSDLDEIMERSDRILVFSGGKVATALRAEDTSVQQLGELIGGKGL